MRKTAPSAVGRDRAVVELVSTQFSQRQHGKRGGESTALHVEVLGQTEAVFHGALSFAEGVLDQNVTESRDFASGFRQGSNAENVAKHNADVLAALEAAQQQRNITLERARTKAGQRFRKFLVGKTAVQLLLAEEGLQQIGITDQSFTDVATISEDRDRIMR
jgi:hypothetical protein